MKYCPNDGRISYPNRNQQTIKNVSLHVHVAVSHSHAQTMAGQGVKKLADPVTTTDRIQKLGMLHQACKLADKIELE